MDDGLRPGERGAARPDLERLHDRVGEVDRQLELLDAKTRQLDGLVARYQRRREEMELVTESQEFNRMVEDWQDHSVVASTPAATRVANLGADTDELDDETERLLGAVEAERELDEMLRN